jgi:ribosome biogenesis protein BMS1
VTGKWGKGEDDEDGEEGGEEDDEVYGDFEDLETGEKFESTGTGINGRKLDKEDEEIRRLAAKAELKAKFDEEYEAKKLGSHKAEEEEPDEDAEALELARKMKEEQAARNKEEFGEEGEGARLRYEGFRQGLYVRIVIKAVPAEFSRHFRPTLPVVLGGLLPHETSMGLIRARVKRHRWHRKVKRPSHYTSHNKTTLFTECYRESQA